MESVSKLSHILSVLFPQFSSPVKSRFLDSFKESNSYFDKNPFSKIIIEPTGFFDIKVDKIMAGGDKRTSVIIKGFPSVMEIGEVYYLLKLFCQDIIFFYIPKYIKEKKKYMYSFVNVMDYKSLLPLFLGLQNLKNKVQFYCGYDFSELEIYYSKTQGQNALIKKCYSVTENSIKFY